MQETADTEKAFGGPVAYVAMNGGLPLIIDARGMDAWHAIKQDTIIR